MTFFAVQPTNNAFNITGGIVVAIILIVIGFFAMVAWFLSWRHSRKQ